MVLKRQITARIKEVLEKHPEGISITDLVKSVDINRNTAGRYLENLLLSGQVEMRRFGMAKLYTLAKRLPVSSVLSISSELVMQLDFSQRVVYANDPLLSFLGAQAKDLFGKNIEFTPFSIVFEDVFTELLDRFRKGLKGEEWRGELSCPVREKYFFCRVAPTVFNEGTKGVSVLLEDITGEKRDGERIRKSESRLRGIFKVSPIGIGVAMDRVLLEVNDLFCQMTGYSEAELVGKSARILYPSNEAFDRIGTEQINQMRQNGSFSAETTWIRRDGTAIDVLFSATPLDPANISGGITFTALDITGRNRAGRAMRESEARLQLALSSSETGMWEIDIPSSKGMIDERAAAILGYPKSEIGEFQADWDTLSHPDDVPLIHQRLSDYLEGRTAIFESEHRMQHRSGRWIWVVGRGKITRRLPDGSCIRVSGTMQDITERKMAEQALRESEDRYRKLVEISPDAVILHQDGKIIYLNPAAVRLTGARSISDLVGTQILDLIAPGYRESVRSSISRDLAGEVTPPMELAILRTDNTPVMVEGRGVSTTIGGRPAVLVALNDINERYQADLALRESEERYRSMFENTGAATAIVEENTIISLMNSEFERFSGYSKAEIERKRSWTEFVEKKDLERMLAIHYRRRESGDVPRQYEFGFVKRNGEVRRVLNTVALIPGTSRAVASLIDITDRKVAEQALGESENRYRTLTEASQDIIFVVDRDDRVEYVNSSAAAVLGLPVYRITGRKRSDFFIGDLGTRQAAGLDRVFRSGQAAHSEGAMEIGGSLHWFDHYLMPIRSPDGTITAVMGVSRDITEWRSSEQALRESGEQYRFIAEHSLDIINRQTPECILTYVSPAITPVLGYTEAEVLGKPVLAMVHPDDLPGVQRDILEILRSGRDQVISTFRFRHRDGRYLWFESATRVIRDKKSGVVREFLSISRDITTRVEPQQEEQDRV